MISLNAITDNIIVLKTAKVADLARLGPVV